MIIRYAKKLLPFLVFVVFCPFISNAQNHVPVAVNDTASTLSEVPVLVNVLLNDYDPDGDTIRISGYPKAQHGQCQKIDSSIRYTSYYFTGTDTIKYCVWDKPYNHSSYSNTANLVIEVKPNPDLPLAINDTSYTISADSLLLNVTRNDIDPEGDTIQIDPDHLIRSRYVQVLKVLNDSVLHYRSIPSFTGTDTIKYRVRKSSNHDLYSNYAKMIIHVGSNPGIPVAVNDTFDYLSYSQAHFIPVANDMIPTQDSMEIYFIPANFPYYAVVNKDMTLDYYDEVMNKNEPSKFLYKLRRKNDHAIYSNNAWMVIRYAHNPQYFYAIDDSLSVDAFGSVAADIVSNDYNPDPSSYLKILSGTHGFLSDSVRYSAHKMSYYPNNRFPGTDSLVYIVTSTSDTVKKSPGKVKINVRNKDAQYLDINNVRALFFADGLHFFNQEAQFEVPKGSEKTTVAINALWIGGLDEDDSLHFAGEKYRQGPTVASAFMHPDFYVGPVMNPGSYGRNMDSTWSRIWKLDRSDIEYHHNHYQDQGYQPIHDILTWPGNGTVFLGQADKLAPYTDLNGDGHYNAMDGDYPEIRGDQALFFIFNDDRDIHKESQGKKLRIEIQGLAYAFDRPDDTAFKNTDFLHYTIINRSQETYKETYSGVFTDTDIGIDYDDWIGCDVERNMYFGYNGDSVDGNGQVFAYGSHPPMQAVVLLGGPKMDADGIDNPRVDNLGNQLCDESVNGLFFGDTIIDNERYGMSRFVYFNTNQWFLPPFHLDPLYAMEYYNMMKGLWSDSTQVLYGGLSHEAFGAYGPACLFSFPGNSDSLNWGTGCEPPNGPVDWTMGTAKLRAHDCKGVSVSGPFTFKPGDRQDIDVAFVWARDYDSSGPTGSLAKLRNAVDQINKAFAENSLPDGTPIYGIDDRKNNQNLEFNIFPNPAINQVTVEFGKDNHGLVNIQIISIEGNILKEFTTSGKTKVLIDVSDLPGGVYVVRCQSSQTVGTKKIIIIR